ncbi:hypothetical protein COV12_04170 [Candidatus Woesearchaeota archaeon CG10_big_fil_rev_8_21_14_0_10_32_24]|nr:MAG: hypothetical protein COV12_04170 [Candidatus Woesearchaeota archaeon CG10_big_fil_rev_8_21_14_0_10_32_24]
MPDANAEKQPEIEMEHLIAKPRITKEPNFHSEWAVVSLLLSLFGFIVPFIFSTLAIIFAVGGLMQANREGLKGKWMAVLAILFGITSIIIYTILVIIGINLAQQMLAQFGDPSMLLGLN